MLKSSLKIPLLIGALVWAAATYFKIIYTKEQTGGIKNLVVSTSSITNDLEIMSDDGIFGHY